MNKDANPWAEPRVKKPDPETVGEHLDKCIAHTRRVLENQCMAKARAEALQMLDWPREEVYNILTPGLSF